ncbi:MAG TPA: hypothetical protein VI479_01265 [Blastocatellia bacterium]
MLRKYFYWALIAGALTMSSVEAVEAIVFAGFVWPCQLLLAAGLRGIVERMPMKQYAKYPFRVCVNDQFDRLSAPIEFCYTRDEVEGWMRRAGLGEIVVRRNFGWCATGRKPART